MSEATPPSRRSGIQTAGYSPPFVYQNERPRRQHPAAIVFLVINFVRRSIVPLLIAGVAGGRVVGALLFIPAAITLAASVVGWWRFTYRFDGNAFEIDQGVFQRSKRVILADRVQQVEVVAELRHRILGVVSLVITDASGSTSGGLKLAAISRREADELQAVLLAARDSTAGVVATAEAPVEAVDDGQTLVALSVGQLAVGGVTGAQLLVMVSLAFSVLQFADDLFGDPFDVVRRFAPGSRPSLGAGLAVLAPVWLALAAGASVFTYAGFTLVRIGDRLRTRGGLVNRREAQMTVSRLQAIRIDESFIRRPFGLAAIRFQSGAGAGAVRVPVIERRRIDALVHAVLAAVDRLPALSPSPRAALRRSVVRSIAVPVVVAVVATRLWWPRGSLTWVLAALAGWTGHAAWRARGMALTNGVLVTRRGAPSRETAVVPVRRAQSIRLTSSPFQRRAGLATLRVELAGGGSPPTATDFDADHLAALVPQVLAAAADDEKDLRATHQWVAAMGDEDASGGRGERGESRRGESNP